MDRSVMPSYGTPLAGPAKQHESQLQTLADRNRAIYRAQAQFRHNPVSSALRNVALSLELTDGS